MNILESLCKLNIELSDIFFFSEMDKEIEEFYSMQGYNNYIYYLNIPNEDIELLKKIETLNLKLHLSPFKSSKDNQLSKQLSLGKLFLTSFFDMHNVLYLKKNKLQKGSPFSIKVETIEDDILCGFLQKQDIQKNNNEFESMFINILLSNKISPFTSIIYSHEITHSQLCSLKGSIENLYNDELLSIFMELLYGYYCKNDYINNTIITSRTIDILEYYKTIINYASNSKKMDENLYQSSMFYISTITAVKLFILYKNGSDILKKEILSSIQKVFDENRTLEETLKIYDLDWSKKRS